MSAPGAAAAARRGARLLLMRSQVLQRQPHQQQSWLAPPVEASASRVGAGARSFGLSAAPSAEAKPPAAAAGAAASAKQQQQQQGPQLSPQRVAAFDFARQTFGAVLDRYNPSAQAPLSPLSPFAPAGRAALRRRFGDLVSKGVVISHLNRRVPGFALGELKASAVALYEQVNAALAGGQRGLAAAEDSVASGELQRLRGDAHARALAGWERIEWRLAEPVRAKDVKIVHARYAQVAASSMTGFVQITFKIPSKQVFAAYRRRRRPAAAAGGGGGGGGGAHGGGGSALPRPPASAPFSESDSPWELVAGDPQGVLDAEDYWVLERKTAADDRLNRDAATAGGGGGAGGAGGGQRAADPPGARWRLVARLSLHGQASSPPQQQQQQRQQQQR